MPPALRHVTASIAGHVASPARAASPALPPSLASELGSLGAAMGIAPRTVALVPAPGLASRAGRAAALEDAVLVDPDRLPASSSERRGLLAHELAHVGQLRRPAPATPAPVAAAEREAHLVGAIARSGASAIPPPALAADRALLWGELGAAHVEAGALVQITTVSDTAVTSETTLDMSWNGDRFQLRLSLEGASLQPSIRYLGSDVASTTSAQWSAVALGDTVIDSAIAISRLQPRLPQGDPATAARRQLELQSQRTIARGPTPPGGGRSLAAYLPALTVDVPRVNQAGGSHLVLALGEGLPEVTIYDDLDTVDAWTPALRRHSFTFHVDDRSSGAHEFAIRSADALPTTVAHQLAEPMPDTLHDSTVPARVLLDSASSDLEAALAAPDLGFAATIPGPVLQSLRAEIARRRGAAPASTAPGSSAAPASTEDPRTRQGAADLLLALSEATPRLRFLHTLDDPNGYLGGPSIGNRAVACVAQVRALIAAYVFVALDGDRARTSGRRHAALAAFARLPFQIADLYLQAGGGLATLEQRQRDLAWDIMQTRGHTHTGTRTIDRLLGIAPDSGRAGSADRLAAQADALRAALLRGDPQLLPQLMEATIDAQRRSGLLAIRAAHDQFTYFAQELDTVLDPVVGVVSGGGRYNVARSYRDRFDRLLSSVERLDRLDPAAVDAAISGFNRIVSAQEFETDVQSIQTRLHHIEVVRIVARIVAITAVAALGGAAVGSMAGAGLSTAARAFTLGSRAEFVLVEGGSLVADVGAFTFLSRTGEQILIGPSQRSFSADFAINLATLGLLRGVGAAYGAWRPAFRATSPRLFAAGGVVTGAVSAHVFGELVHVLETGHAMSGSDRGIAIAQNLALVGVLHLGRYFTQPLEARLTRGISSLLGSDRVFRAELARLETRRAQVVADALALNGRTDASPQEVARVLAEADAHFRAELDLIRRAARFHSLPAGELQAAIGSHVRALATLELRFAQEGAPSPLGVEATFRRAAPGVVEYAADPATRAFLEAYYREQGGTLTIEGDRLVGEIDGRRTHYVPRIEAGGAGAVARTPHAAALEGTLGDLQGRVDVRENTGLPGRSVVVRTTGGRVVIEVGSRATDTDVGGHLDEARAQLQFLGPAGRVRALQERLVTLLRIRPGRGTLGAEAAREVVKLRQLRDRLRELDRETARDARSTDEARNAERLADLERQLAYYESQLGSYERARGYVAAFDTTVNAVTELRDRFPHDQVVASGDRLVFNGALEVSREALEQLDQAAGEQRVSGLEELADLSRALREVGGDPAQLSTELRARFEALQRLAPDLGVHPTAPPARGADPLILAAGAPLAARADAAAGRAARLARVVSGPIDVGLAAALTEQVTAAATAAHAAQTEAERTASDAELTRLEAALLAVETRYTDELDLARAETARAAVESLATDVPGGDTARLGPEELARVRSLRSTIETMRTDRTAFDRATLDAILRELGSLQARVEAQQATDRARTDRLARGELADRERALDEGRATETAGRPAALTVDWLGELRTHYAAFLAETPPDASGVPQRRPGAADAEATLQRLELRATAAADAERTARTSGDADALARAQAEQAAVALEVAALKVRLRELAARALGAELGVTPASLHGPLEVLSPGRLREIHGAVGASLFGLLTAHPGATLRGVSEALAGAAPGADRTAVAVDVMARETGAQLGVDPASVRELVARLPPSEIAGFAAKLTARDLTALGALLVRRPGEAARVREALAVADPNNLVRNTIRDLLRRNLGGTLGDADFGQAVDILARIAQAFPTEIAGSIDAAGTRTPGTKVRELAQALARGDARLVTELLRFERDLVEKNPVEVGGRRFRPDYDVLHGERHSPDWPEADVRARATAEGNPQGRFASYAEVRWAVEQGARLPAGTTRAVIGGTGVGALPGTLPSWFRAEVFPVGGGPPVRANSILVLVRANGEVHTYPGVDLRVY